MSSEPPKLITRRWRRRAFVLALLIAPPALWFSSQDFRLVLYQWAYPVFDKPGQDWIFKRIREVEERPDVAWRCYAAAAEDPAEAWKTAFEACARKGPFEFRGLEDELVAVLEDPRLYPAHDNLFEVLWRCRVKDPRLPPLLLPYLEHRDLKTDAAWSLAINGRPEEALPVLISVVAEPPKEGGAGDESAPAIPYEVTRALDALRDMGAKARPALPVIRPWAEARSEPLEQRHALAALWVIDRDERALERLKSMLDTATRGGNSHHVYLARLLAELGQGDEAVRLALMGWWEKNSLIISVGWDSEPGYLNMIGWLGAVGEPSLPALEKKLAGPDPAIRHAARQAIAAIHNDRRGRP